MTSSAASETATNGYACNGQHDVAVKPRPLEVRGQCGSCDVTLDEAADWQVSEAVLRRIGRAVFVEVNLDVIADNFRLLKEICRNKQIGESSEGERERSVF